MFSIKVRRVVMIHQIVDFRKHWNGLLVESRKFGFEPYDGDMIVFVKRDKTQLRAMCGDKKGLFIFSRRFEGSGFGFDFDKQRRTISLAELAMWFDGANYIIKKRVKLWKKQLL